MPPCFGFNRLFFSVFARFALRSNVICFTLDVVVRFQVFLIIIIISLDPKLYTLSWFGIAVPGRFVAKEDGVASF